AALVLTATGGMASSKATMLVAGVAWLVASVCVHRLQADGWVGPEIRYYWSEDDAEDNRERAPYVLALFGVGAIIVGFTMR
ncbi:MAG TPA: hypothetical protein VEQ58_02340, partial [Polyangiaceae bacterium]|nr:hypothetical protein [Polyangiaceae bacterium]